ncbi:putative disease resistance RPP13-like protein 1-like isoform X1 [Hibiscus syriacus]|uniref:Disease resistance RPP13-like protein 1-like isoform X1 n=1 Tax=Hibiscus syriacus TaxID=106335 RepID=A0A6A2XVB9_HIBSY|nr:thioredoxin-like fold domain-containing protein MRL7L, chloroplastic isoform X2 [Hibiscus syriacus]XP_039051188.1 thioredoxin-like fold domain-containing protein MRL7L, chloroplastic isoform X2 [Hibiscus syriacus]KAE8658074.1 putative disease resistance RPP13-like protein 1-like isoform X1 [Hibiscus syriacus]
MALQHSIHLRYWICPVKLNKLKPLCSKLLKMPSWNPSSIRNGVRAYGMVEKFGKKFMGQEISDSDDDDDDDESSLKNGQIDDSYHFDADERREWRAKIREVINKHPEIEGEIDPVDKLNKMQKLLADYPLVVDEDDPDWPEDADGRGFNLDQFFDKITIKNNNKENDDADDYDSEKEIVWQDDDYIRPIKDIKTNQWEETVFKDISPLIILVHNRYKRPKENEIVWDELTKAVHIIWNCRLPSPRCVAVDAVVEDDLVSALNVSGFPEIIFTKAGKILYRERAVRTADELSKMMAFYYYGAAKPPCLDCTGDKQERIPTVVIKR